MAKTIMDFLEFESSATPEFKSTVTKEIWTINFWSTGQQLLNAIMDKARGKIFDTKLTFRSLPNACGYRDDGTLWYDPSYFKRTIFEPTQATVVASNKTYVYLFHELVHYYHDLAGTYDKDAQGGTPEEEFRTVGIYQNAFEPLSENGLRKEAMLPRRPVSYTHLTLPTNREV